MLGITGKDRPRCMSCCCEGRWSSALRASLGRLDADREAIQSAVGYFPDPIRSGQLRRAVAFGRRCASRPPDRNSARDRRAQACSSGGELLDR